MAFKLLLKTEPSTTKMMNFLKLAWAVEPQSMVTQGELQQCLKSVIASSYKQVLININCLSENRTLFKKKKKSCSKVAFYLNTCLLCFSCKEYKNLNSFFAIVMGLSNVAVSRLALTWEVGELHGIQLGLVPEG